MTSLIERLEGASLQRRVAHRSTPFPHNSSLLGGFSTTVLATSMPTSPPLTGPARSIGAGYTHSNGALKQIRLARTLSQWLINLATHLALSAVFFPTYLLTLHASGGYSVMIRDIAGPLRAEFPACDTKPQVDCDTAADLKDMREEATYECRKLFKRSLGVLLYVVETCQTYPCCSCYCYTPPLESVSRPLSCLMTGPICSF